MRVQIAIMPILREREMAADEIYGTHSCYELNGYNLVCTIWMAHSFATGYIIHFGVIT